MVDEREVWPTGTPRVGQKGEMRRGISKHDIARFTALSGGSQSAALREELTKATNFRGLIVQGGATSAIVSAVVAEKLPGRGTVFLHVDRNLQAPVRPGDPITGAVEVLKVRSDKPITKLMLSDGTVALEGEALCYTMPLPSPAA